MRANTIGEVLNRLRDEFDDITISKIRYLEAEGLIHPDRTESGYRKFTENDIQRLRFVLRAQRDGQLSLDDIRAELDEHGDRPPGDHDRPSTRNPPPVTAVDEPEDVDDVEATIADREQRDMTTIDLDATDLQLTLGELGDASGLAFLEVSALCEHGILARQERYDGTDLRIARLCARMIEGGLEPRHIRMYRQFAEREAALLEQLVAPLLRQRNPDSRKQAAASADELAEVGAELQKVVLQGALRRVLHSWR